LERAVSRYDDHEGFKQRELPPSEYKIQVFSLNAKRRKGEAYLIHNDHVYTVKLEIGGSAPISRSRLSLSLYEDKQIPLAGRLVVVGDRPKRLITSIEPSDEAADLFLRDSQSDDS
jgi:hypothetical protein